MESIKSPFFSPFPPPLHPRRRSAHPPSGAAIITAGAAESSDPWTLSDGNSGKPRSRPYRRDPRKPLSDDDARRIINAKAQYLSRLRRNQGSLAQTPRWIRRTPDQMAQLLQDDRNGHLYGRHVTAAVRAVRSLSGRPAASYDMRRVMASFITKLTFRDMCVVLKEQKGWRQARDFFAWMKLQLCYRPSVVVYTILLRIYGQVGKIKLSEEIFLEMMESGCEPDEVACGTMLCAYARWGRHEDMMLFYTAVRRREIMPSVTVFNFMISSLQKKKLHKKVIELWKQMLDGKVEPNRFSYTIALSSYAKEELLEDALSLLGEMKKKGFVPEEASYSLLISLAAKHGRQDDAVQLYEEMRAQGIVPSNYTCASLLTLHYKNADYSRALSLFSEMGRNKIVPDEVIYGILVRIYGKLGLYEDAQRTFADIEKCGLLTDEKTYVVMAQVHMNTGNHDKALEVLELLRSRNVEMSEFSYSALLRCYIAKEEVGSAEVTFHSLCKAGSPDAFCYNDLLSLYIKRGLMEKAKALVIQMRKDGVHFDQELYRTVMVLYCKEAMVAEAELLAEEIESNGFSMDKTMKTSLMAMYSRTGGLRKAENLLKTLEKPDAAAFCVMLCLYLENGDIYKSKEMLKYLLETTNGLTVASQLIAKFVREGDVAKAESMYGQCIELGFRPEDAAIASLLASYGRHQQLRQVQELYTSTSSSHTIARAVYSSAIDAYCRCGEVGGAYQVYKEMVKQGHAPDAVTISIFVNALAKDGKYQEAECIIENSFHGSWELDTVAYNTYIKAMLDSGKLYSAVSIYDRMISLGLQPSLQTLNTMISVYGQGGKLDKAVQMFKSAQSLGMAIDEKAYTNMISYYGKAGRSQEAFVLFNEMKDNGMRPGKISYNTMLNAYAIAGLHHEAENLFEDMKRDGHPPDSLTYLALIRAYTEAHEFCKAEQVAHRMQKEGISPSCAHFNHLIFAFTRVGSFIDVERVYSHMKQAGLSPDLACCRTMLRAYMEYGLVDRGISFFESINGILKPDGFMLSAAIHLYEYVGNESMAGHILDVMNMHGLLFLRNLSIGSKLKTGKSLEECYGAQSEYGT